MMAATCKHISVTHVAMLYAPYWLRDMPAWKTTLADAGMTNIGTVQVEDTIATLPVAMSKLHYDTAKCVCYYLIEELRTDKHQCVAGL